MIRNAVVFTGSITDLVDAYNLRTVANKDPRYWENQEVNPVRQVVKQHYLHEQNNRCCYCGIHIPSNHGRLWDIEHIVPKSTHPAFLFKPENLAISCVDCNIAKQDASVLTNNSITRYPRRSNAFLLVHPHYDELDEHIAVFLDRIYIPKSEKGEYTISICRLLRRAYNAVGWDSGLADEENMMDALDQMMNTTDKTTIENHMMQVLMMCQVRVSRSLFSTTDSSPLPASTSSEAQR